MPEIRLPLVALEQTDACELDRRIAAFEAHHGHPPGEDSTWAEWCAVTPALEDRLWAVAHALPLAYPDQRAELLRVVVEVAYRAAARVQPADPEPRVTAALALARRWLDGEPIPATHLSTAARAASDAAYAAAAADTAADTAARAAAYAAACAAASDTASDAAYAYAYASYASASDAASEAASEAATEREQQLEDLDDLLAALRLEVRNG